jgi:hypothetical protein
MQVNVANVVLESGNLRFLCFKFSFEVGFERLVSWSTRVPHLVPSASVRHEVLGYDEQNEMVREETSPCHDG